MSKKIDEEMINEEVEELDDIVELIDEEGTAHQYYHIGTMDENDKKYVFFQPAEEIEGADPDDVVIFELDEANEALLPVEDEDLLQKIFDKFVAEYEGEYGEDGDDDYIN